MKIFNVSQLLLELKETFEKSGNRNKGMKQYLVNFRVRFLAFAWEKYHSTKISSGPTARTERQGD